MKTSLKHEKLFLQWNEKNYRIVIEEVNGVVWGYLLKDEKIISDVWLYNLLLAPEHPPWKGAPPSEAPFLNSKQYLRDKQLVPEDPETQLTVFCSREQDDVFQVWIAVKPLENLSETALLAVIRDDTRTGWNRNVVVDGPCAKTMCQEWDEEWNEHRKVLCTITPHPQHLSNTALPSGEGNAE